MRGGRRGSYRRPYNNGNQYSQGSQGPRGNGMDLDYDAPRRQQQHPLPQAPAQQVQQPVQQQQQHSQSNHQLTRQLSCQSKTCITMFVFLKRAVLLTPLPTITITITRDTI
ncbi:hypothetical protein BCR33DRAFT_461658 [Rhizoclosmatium globosum]|uniref:Uncharacterized protein n=1 Tax=Rhizoclosmatium globosum TaxID=329046 RepID=A0A1Y2CXB5_9FUNG|nr:hypothetical protein BCR33DRAFT_461658 [Rhizoclosmatium globosum]|eukprot:ORY51679.1 hypothetical protein BCR33DRAFT_461658 [Rhizoclosmatium globosum]